MANHAESAINRIFRRLPEILFISATIGNKLHWNHYFTQSPGHKTFRNPHGENPKSHIQNSQKIPDNNYEELTYSRPQATGSTVTLYRSDTNALNSYTHVHNHGTQSEPKRLTLHDDHKTDNLSKDQTYVHTTPINSGRQCIMTRYHYVQPWLTDMHANAYCYFDLSLKA